MISRDGGLGSGSCNRNGVKGLRRKGEKEVKTTALAGVRRVKDAEDTKAILTFCANSGQSREMARPRAGGLSTRRGLWVDYVRSRRGPVSLKRRRPAGRGRAGAAPGSANDRAERGVPAQRAPSSPAHRAPARGADRGDGARRPGG